MNYSEEIDALTPNLTHLYRDGVKIGQMTFFPSGSILCESVHKHVEVFNYPETARAFLRACRRLRRGKKKYEEQLNIIKF